MTTTALRNCVDCGTPVSRSTSLRPGDPRCRRCAQLYLRTKRRFAPPKSIVIAGSTPTPTERLFSSHCPTGEPHHYILGIGATGGACSGCGEVYSKKRVKDGIASSNGGGDGAITLTELKPLDYYYTASGVNNW